MPLADHVRCHGREDAHLAPYLLRNLEVESTSVGWLAHGTFPPKAVSKLAWKIFRTVASDGPERRYHSGLARCIAPLACYQSADFVNGQGPVFCSCPMQYRSLPPRMNIRRPLKAGVPPEPPGSELAATTAVCRPAPADIDSPASLATKQVFSRQAEAWVDVGSVCAAGGGKVSVFLKRVLPSGGVDHEVVGRPVHGIDPAVVDRAARR